MLVLDGFCGDKDKGNFLPRMLFFWSFEVLFLHFVVWHSCCVARCARILLRCSPEHTDQARLLSDGQNHFCPGWRTRGGSEGWRGQEVDMRLKAEKDSGGGTMEGGPAVESWPAACSTVHVKQHTSGIRNIFYVGYIKNKYQLLYKIPPLQCRDINNGN